MQEREKTLHIPIGYCCNNNCIFCMDDKEKIYGIKEVTKEKYENILRTSAEKFERVMFMGGEPTTNELLPGLIEYAKKIGYPEIALITNGRRLSYVNFCNRLISCGLNRVAVSVHGYDKQSHESLTRTPGSFEQTVKGLVNLKQLRSKGIIKNFTINATVTKLNYMQLEKMYNFFIGFSPDIIIFNMFNPIGNAKKMFDMLMPKYSEVSRILEKIQSKEKENLSLIDFPACTIRENLSRLGELEDSHINKEDMSEKISVSNSPYLRGSLDGKIKLKRCEKCMVESFCHGIPKIYLEKIGDEEFTPIILENEKK
jgi:molybdenum cofactor biosynthesis enzyme MoaA